MTFTPSRTASGSVDWRFHGPRADSQGPAERRNGLWVRVMQAVSVGLGVLTCGTHLLGRHKSRPDPLPSSALRALLHAATAQARSLIEAALARVIEIDQIEL